VCIYCHIYHVCGGSVTNNSTRVRIGYRIYSLWRLQLHRVQLLRKLSTRSSLDPTDGTVLRRRLTWRTDLFCFQTLTNSLCCPNGKHPTTVARQPCNATIPSRERIHRDPLSLLGMAQLYPGYGCEQVTIVARSIPDTIVAFGQTRHYIYMTASVV
jgi:hypothetical protein